MEVGTTIGTFDVDEDVTIKLCQAVMDFRKKNHVIPDKIRVYIHPVAQMIIDRINYERPNTPGGVSMIMGAIVVMGYEADILIAAPERWDVTPVRLVLIKKKEA